MQKNTFLEIEFNKLRAKWRRIKEEFDSIKNISDLAWSEFYPAFLIEIKEKDIEDPFNKNCSTEELKDNSIFEEEEVKQKYRDAARLTHPDKSNGKIESFKNISKAKKEGSLNDFYDELKKIKASKGDISFMEVDKISNEIKLLESKIQEINNSPYIKWFYGTHLERNKIMKSIITFIKNDQKKNKIIK